ncbi:MAG: ABC transporter substrate-binding protein [Acetobacteraceae bacterium]
MLATRRALTTGLLAFAATRGAAQAAEPIVIGGMVETSGFLATLGNQGLEGMQLATDQINAAGQGPQIRLVNVNTESDETKAVTVARRLIEREQVVGIIGAMNSGANLAILDLVQRAGVPLISNGASRAIVTPASERRWVFQVPLNDLLATRTILAAMRAKGISKVALIAADSAFGVSGVQAWEQLGPEYGVAIVAQQTYGNLDQDMTPHLTNLRGKGAQAVVLWATGPGQSIAIKNYRQLGIDVPLYASPGAADPNVIKLAGAAANGVLFAASKLYVADALTGDDPQKSIVQAFAKDFAARYGRPPSPFAGYGYDAVRMLHNAILKGGTDKEKIRDAIEALTDYPAVTGIYSYSPNDHLGLKPGSAIMLTIADGAFRLAPA